MINRIITANVAAIVIDDPFKDRKDILVAKLLVETEIEAGWGMNK